MLRRAIRALVGQYVSDEEEIEEEVAGLFGSLSRSTEHGDRLIHIIHKL